MLRLQATNQTSLTQTINGDWFIKLKQPFTIEVYYTEIDKFGLYSSTKNVVVSHLIWIHECNYEIQRWKPFHKEYKRVTFRLLHGFVENNRIRVIKNNNWLRCTQEENIDISYEKILSPANCFAFNKTAQYCDVMFHFQKSRTLKRQRECDELCNK